MWMSVRVETLLKYRRIGILSASRHPITASSRAQDTLRATGRPEVKPVAVGVAMNCKRLDLTLASLARQKGWTLPPPESPLRPID
jgi:hypothetical protein